MAASRVHKRASWVKTTSKKTAKKSAKKKREAKPEASASNDFKSGAHASFHSPLPFDLTNIWPQMGELSSSGLAGWPVSAQAMPKLQIEPSALALMQTEYSTEIAALTARMLEARSAPAINDKRFSAPAWQGSHAYLADLYLINARFMQRMADSLDTDNKTRAKIQFAVQQWVDAMSPANYLATNPEAQEKLIESQGESLTTGLVNMLADLKKGRISQTDESAFEVGKNVATTQGDVVYQNQIFQLIQYRPSTPTVFERPLVMVPPCINKYYILDLQPENSFVGYAISQGHTVFMLSWKNPGQDDAALTWDEYIEEGVIRALHTVQEITGEKTLNLLGFCVGGTMLATALAVLARRKERLAASLTLLTTLLDFSDTGVLDVFVDENAVTQRERSIGGMGGPIGLMPARDLATSFSFLRPNDLVWNYVVSNYLKGQSPAPFDLLYWNADSTNLPGPFFVWYLRNTYLENRLKDKDGVEVCGEKIDFRRIDVPTYLYGSREDHIVPWKTAYEGTRLLSGDLRFVLGASGHIAGVINPPQKKKRCFWTATSEGARDHPGAQDWFDGAIEQAGSWWPDWAKWLSQTAGAQVKAPKRPGNQRYPSLEAAPGSYVRARAV